MAEMVANNEQTHEEWAQIIIIELNGWMRCDTSKGQTAVSSIHPSTHPDQKGIIKLNSHSKYSYFGQKGCQQRPQCLMIEMTARVGL